MAAISDNWKLIGFRKKDVNRNWSQLVIRINNLKSRRDVVQVFFPNESSDPLVVMISGKIVCNKLLPGGVVTDQCKYKIKTGDKGEIELKLRKIIPEDWMHRWSPSRESNNPVPSLSSTSTTNTIESDNNNNTNHHNLDSSLEKRAINQNDTCSEVNSLRSREMVANVDHPVDSFEIEEITENNGSEERSSFVIEKVRENEEGGNICNVSKKDNLKDELIIVPNITEDDDSITSKRYLDNGRINGSAVVDSEPVFALAERMLLLSSTTGLQS